MAVKKKVITKKKPRARAGDSKVIQEQIALFEAQTAARYRIAKTAYDHQDKETREALDRIVDRLRTAQSGYLRIFPNGKQNPSVAIPISLEMMDKNMLFVATEILKDLAFLDVQVANYQFPTVYCAECGEKLTTKKKVRR